MDLTKTLSNIGLSDKEARLYLSLLEYNEALPSVLSRKSGIKRPTTYVILEQLKARGLVSQVRKGGATYFRALSPYSLLDDQHEKYSALEEALPELLQLNSKFAATPQMTLYEGENGIVRIMEDTLTTSTELLCWADVSLAVGTILSEYYPSYVKKKVANGVWLRGIFCDDKRAREFQTKGKEELREVYLIPKKKFPFKNEINVYDDKLAIISHADKIGVIIQNKSIADTQRSIFELGWEYAKLLSKK
jgi:HTH-type transcriptional regulator, sugar sensing transcriptional regulator